MGEFGDGNESLRQLLELLMSAWLIASMIWVVMLVHQDALPGTKQDWLTRPIGRMDVLVAKVIFAVLVVQGASIAGDLIQGLSSGFPLSQSFHAAIVRAAIGLVWITIPALLIGVLTQSIADAMVTSVVFFLGIIVFMVVAVALSGGSQRQLDPTEGSGVKWIPDLLRHLLIVVGGAIVMLMQYRTRKTLLSRRVAAAMLFVMLSSQTLGWKPIFALEKRLSSQPGAAGEITFAWRPHTESMRNETRQDPFYGAIPNFGNPNGTLVFPLSVAGLPADSVLREDEAVVVLADANGRMLYAVNGKPIQIWHEGAQSGPVAYDQTVIIPPQFFQENKDRLVRVETTHSVTLFKFITSYSMAAVGGDIRMPKFGRCKSKIDGGATDVKVDCMQIGPGPTCATVFLEDPRDGSRNRPLSACHPNYSPYIDQPIPDSVSRFPMDLPFRDRTRQLKFSVDASKIGDAQIVIRVYEPVDHFTRVVESPLVMMNELAAR
jgi:ABC-type transport system involved in multi-copper enzyme maturation permease subunit